MTVRADLYETNRLVERNGLIHLAGHRVEAHVCVTKLTRFVNDRLNQDLPEAVRAKCGPHKQALHFADAVAQFPQCNAAGQMLVFRSEQQATVRWGVVAGEVFQFLIEILKAQTESETRSVLLEEDARRLNLLVGRGLEDLRQSCLQRNRRQDRSRLLSNLIVAVR